MQFHMLVQVTDVSKGNIAVDTDKRPLSRTCVGYIMALKVARSIEFLDALGTAERLESCMMKHVCFEETCLRVGLFTLCTFKLFLFCKWFWSMFYPGVMVYLILFYCFVIALIAGVIFSTVLGVFVIQ